MKHLQIFNSMSEFEAAKPSMDTPFVVLEKGTPKVIYSNLPEISEDDLPTGVVDLGLSVKWASCNIGANTPCESGLLFQFGRVDGYAYGDTNHQFSSTNPPVTASGKTYNAGATLNQEDDAAYVATNGKLRMPTKAEMDELLSGTTNTWCQCTVLGEDHASHTVYGRLFTSKSDESKKLFIPATGGFSSGSFLNSGSFGYVWSSSVSSSYPSEAYVLYFGSGDTHAVGNRDRDRNDAFSVRGVQDK